MVLCVGLEMIRQVIDALAENGDLDFRRTGVGVVRAVTANEFGLAVFAQGHWASSTSGPGTSNAPGTPYTQKTITRTSSICYLRTTDGCKAPDSADGRASPT